ncbi:hypothetical protein ASC77_08895 [Nocardioides sp. Root1257]|nr:hypothetical protein ASC77_08895 [Nocardioides sp. Root1257]KRC48010.1 hypothetical protein ASE24_08900 [Nocardioides sp. Root224]
MPAVAIVVAYAVLLLCIPSQLIFGPLGAPGTPANMVGIAGLLWWACATIAGQNPVRGLTPTRFVVLLLTCAVLAAYVNGMVKGWYAPPNMRANTDELWTLVTPTVDETTTAMISAADRGLLSFAGWMGVVLVTAEGLRSWRDLDLLVEWLCWLGSFVAVLGLVQFFTGYDIAALFQIPGLTANAAFGEVVSRSVLNRVSATAVHPIEFGVVMGCLFPLALHRALMRWGSRAATFPALLIGVAAFISVSRSAVLVVGAAFIVLLIGWPARWRWNALMLAPVAVVGLRLAIPGLVGTLYSLFSNLQNDPSVKGRTGDYSVVMGLYEQHAVLGRGLFTFVPRYYRILDNQYLMVLVELGVVGLVSCLLFFIVSFFSARRAARHALRPESRHLGLAVSASLVGMALAYATFDAWGFPMAAGMTFLLAGICGATWRLTSEEERRVRASGAAVRLLGPPPRREVEA